MQTSNERNKEINDDIEIDNILLETLLIEDPDARCIDFINYKKLFYSKQNKQYNETDKGTSTNR